MNNLKDNYRQNIVVNTSSSRAFIALTEKIDLWWGKTDGSMTKIGDKFIVSFGDASWSFRVTECVPNEKITWECIGGSPEFNAEWIGDILYWNIVELSQGVKISLLQDGLTPDMNCFEICNRGWKHYITESLQAYLVSGAGILSFEG